ncbi:unnamed protein product [Linum tenue]|uniref:NADH dehydrogenase subunit 1 n=1 Tax=Linum tenue TaxID=586396 RepID=A0AAV0RSP7_9ROSI|nr:unnamed protein product [Linum tenue]
MIFFFALDTKILVACGLLCTKWSQVKGLL